MPDIGKKGIGKLGETISRRWFLFEELTKRDFKQKYKRTVLGMGWSIMAPLLNLLVMKLVFTQFFGRDMPHYTTYLFAGNVVMAFFKEATKGGMGALMANRHIFTRINVPKYIFLLSKNVSATVNFGLTMLVFFAFALLDGISPSVKWLTLLYPAVCLIALNIGVGLILSALYVFFRDIQYLYDIFLTLLTYVSAIFYQVDAFSPAVQDLFMLNPVYGVIRYVRLIVIDGVLPSPAHHLLLALYAAAALAAGCLIYKKKNHAFLYYV